MTVGYLNDYSSTITIGSPITLASPSLTISSSIQTALPVSTSSKTSGEQILSSCSPSSTTTSASDNTSTNDSNPTTTDLNTSKLNASSIHSNHVTKKSHKVNKTGRNHAGAKYLASQYHPVKRIQEIITILIFIPLFIYNLLNIIIFFNASKCLVIFGAASN